MLHVSEIAHYRVGDVRDELQEGDQVLVKVINVDPSGKVRLSRKALLPVPTDDDGSQERAGDKGGGDSPGGRPSRSRSSRHRVNQDPVRR